MSVNDANNTNTTTSDTGQYILTVEEGIYAVTAAPPVGSSYEPSTLPSQNIQNNSIINFTFYNTSSHKIEGHVTNSDGQPISDNKIRLFNNSGFEASVQTDTNGYYSLRGETGFYQLGMSLWDKWNPSLRTPANYWFNTNSFELVGDRIADIVIPAKKIQIHVQDKQGNAIAGVIVRNQAIETTGLFVSEALPFALGVSENNFDNVKTNDSGDATMWIYPNSKPYAINLVVPSGSIYANTVLNLLVKENSIENISLQYSHAAPITTVSLAEDNGNGMYSDPTTVTLSATPASGYTIANTYYTIDGGERQTYTEPFTVSGNGDHAITYWSVDNSGVQESPKAKNFTIASNYTLTGTVYNDLNQNGFQEIGENGYGGATLTLDSGATVITDASGSYSFTDIALGTYVETLTVPTGYCATTTNPVTLSLSADTTQNFGIIQHDMPVSSISINPDPLANGEYPNPAHVTLQATASAGYAIQHTYYQIDGGATQSYTGAFTVPGAGSHTVSYWSVDNTGLEETPHKIKSFTVSSTVSNGYIDPSSGTVNIGNGITISGDVTSGGYVSVTSSSNNSGGPIPSTFKILNTFYNIQSTATFTGDITLTFAYPTTNPNQQLKVLHYDGSSWDQLPTTLLYNAQTQIMTLTVITPSLSPFAIVAPDTTAPVISAFSLSSYTVPTGNTSTIIAKTTDDLTGVEKVIYKMVSSTGSTSTGTLAFISPSGEWRANVQPSVGIYSVEVTAYDFAGNEKLSEKLYLAVYDVSAGFVTGGGFIFGTNNSIGITPDGKSNFGFSAKYAGGVPTGNLTFNYKKDGLEFASTGITWLTVSGNVADFQGTATRNGESGYTYRMHVVDGTQDSVSIRVWDNSHSYDNPTYRIENSLSGGNIVIHQ